MFSGIAPVYDRLNCLLSMGMDRLWRRKMVKMALLDLKCRERLLDVCTGTGDLLHDFVKAGMKEAVGIDFSLPMLREGRKKMRGKEGFCLAQADALSLPFPDGVFDVVSISFGLRNLADRPRGLREMTRVVRPGRVIAILEFSPKQSWWMRPLYFLYLRFWVPLVGNMVSGSVAYAYLRDSIQSFPTSEQVREWMRKAGIEEIEMRPFCGGIAVAYVGKAVALTGAGKVD